MDDSKKQNEDDITFSVDADPELVKFTANGDILIKGKFIENDKDLVDAFREFMIEAQSKNNA